MLRKLEFERMQIPDIVSDILVDSSKRGASDIHCDPYDEFLKIRIRIDGMLVDYAEVPNAYRNNLVTRIKILSGMNITESRLPQDGAIKATIQGLDLDLRVSALPTNKGEKVVIRILDYTRSLSGLEHLDFCEENYKKVLKMIGEPNGIILVTGATGSGKSTTVYSLLERLNKEESNIITVEDPVEMDLRGVNQVQTNSEIGLTFATALRSILRQDPNIIMIGEIRDSETAQIAVRASITGHLVLSTIHTNNSLNTIERLIDMDVEKYLLASSLEGIISQKLARRVCTKCRKKRPTSDYEKQLFKAVLNKDVNEIYEAVGCEECAKGYKGRLGVHEVLVINQKIRDALTSNMPKEKLRELVYNSDVITMLQDGLQKVVNGDTTFEEIIKIIEIDEDENLIGRADLKNAIENSILKSQRHENTRKILESEKKEEEQNTVSSNIISPTPISPQEKSNPTDTSLEQPKQETMVTAKKEEKTESILDPSFKANSQISQPTPPKEQGIQSLLNGQNQPIINPFTPATPTEKKEPQEVPKEPVSNLEEEKKKKSFGFNLFGKK